MPGEGLLKPRCPPGGSAAGVNDVATACVSGQQLAATLVLGNKWPQVGKPHLPHVTGETKPDHPAEVVGVHRAVDGAPSIER